MAVSPRGMSDYAERFGSAADAAAAISTSIPVAAFTSNFFMITLRALGVRQTIMERIPAALTGDVTCDTGCACSEEYKPTK